MLALILVAGLAGCGGGGGDQGVAHPAAVPSPTIIILTLPDGTVGIAYSATVVAIFGFPPFTWSVTGGALPGGLSLDSSTGEVSGTPTTQGTFNFTLKVTDTLNNMDSQDYTVRIGAAIPVVEIISVDSNEVLGNSVSGTPAVSGSGRFVAFTSFATNLVSGDTNTVPDVFLRDRVCTGPALSQLCGFQPADSSQCAHFCDHLGFGIRSQRHSLAEGREQECLGALISGCAPEGSTQIPPALPLPPEEGRALRIAATTARVARTTTGVRPEPELWLGEKPPGFC